MTPFQYASPLPISPNNSSMLEPNQINYSCGICGREFLKESGLKRHQKVHINTTAENSGPSFHCHICRLVFNCPNQYSDHVKLHHSQSQALKCCICACFRPVTANCQTNPFKCESCCQPTLPNHNNEVPPNSNQMTIPNNTPQYPSNQSLIEPPPPQLTTTKKKSKKDKQQVHYPVQTLMNKAKPYQCQQCGKGNVVTLYTGPRTARLRCEIDIRRLTSYSTLPIMIHNKTNN